MLRNCLTASGLHQHLPVVISVEAVCPYKPDPAVYRLVAETLQRPHRPDPPRLLQRVRHRRRSFGRHADRMGQPCGTSL